MFLFDVGKKCGIAQIPFAAGTAELPLRLFLASNDLLMIWTLLVAH